MWPASVKYLAADKPASPAPMTATRLDFFGLGAFLIRCDRSSASLNVDSSSKFGLGKSLACTSTQVRRVQRRRKDRGNRVAADPVVECESCPPRILMVVLRSTTSIQQLAHVLVAFGSQHLQHEVDEQEMGTAIALQNEENFTEFKSALGHRNLEWHRGQPTFVDEQTKGRATSPAARSSCGHNS
jgi:hypothetical protein